ncbi:AAA family ATPase [Salinarimonas soli]|uniref:AAA family ATPase n=2 Tax=Salinarimonas soli TaxID=1638099 RepID=A0A5B2VBR0_9HYPH|nr:AAA family ATPase [Salinarimonas soli]
MLALGLAAIAAGRKVTSYGTEALADKALRVGQELLTPIERQVLASDRRRIAHDKAKAAEAKRRHEERERAKAEAIGAGTEGPKVPEGHVVVCRTAADTGRGAELVKPYKGIVGKAVPLVRTGDLAAVRTSLLREYPHAEEAVGAILAGIPRPWLKLGHVLIRGDPGVGKSRFARRLAELLGAGLLRVDGANDGGASFGGTERRWYSAEPARPFMAVTRFGQANALVLVDEIDKAPTRSDYGRLWDALLGFLDPETAKRFPDPCLQAELDLSWVGVIATANHTFHLPGPLMDRFRVVVDLPKPGPEHLEALLPAVLADLASEKGLDPRFHAPLDGVELSALRARWRGGSLRRLRRMVEAILRVRERGGAALH